MKEFTEIKFREDNKSFHKGNGNLHETGESPLNEYNIEYYAKNCDGFLFGDGIGNNDRFSLSFYTFNKKRFWPFGMIIIEKN